MPPFVEFAGTAMGDEMAWGHPEILRSCRAVWVFAPSGLKGRQSVAGPVRARNEANNPKSSEGAKEPVTRPLLLAASQWEIGNRKLEIRCLAAAFGRAT